MRWKQLVTAMALTGALLLPVVPAAAIDTGLNATADAAQFTRTNEPASASVARLIGNIVNAIITVLGILLMVLFFYGGFEWMTAGGDPTKVKSAKSRITNATVGLLIVLASYTLSSFVLSSLITATTT